MTSLSLSLELMKKPARFFLNYKKYHRYIEYNKRTKNKPKIIKYETNREKTKRNY